MLLKGLHTSNKIIMKDVSTITPLTAPSSGSLKKGPFYWLENQPLNLAWFIIYHHDRDEVKHTLIHPDTSRSVNICGCCNRRLLKCHVSVFPSGGWRAKPNSSLTGLGACSVNTERWSSDQTALLTDTRSDSNLVRKLSHFLVIYSRYIPSVMTITCTVFILTLVSLEKMDPSRLLVLVLAVFSLSQCVPLWAQGPARRSRTVLARSELNVEKCPVTYRPLSSVLDFYKRQWIRHWSTSKQQHITFNIKICCLKSSCWDLNCVICDLTNSAKAWCIAV